MYVVSIARLSKGEGWIPAFLLQSGFPLIHGDLLGNAVSSAFSQPEMFPG